MLDDIELKLLVQQCVDLTYKLGSAIREKETSRIIDSYRDEYKNLLKKAQRIEAARTDINALIEDFDNTFTGGRDYQYAAHLRLKMFYQWTSRLHRIVETVKIATAKEKKKPQEFLVPIPGGSGVVSKSPSKLSKQAQKTVKAESIESEDYCKRVFVVYGRNLEARDAMFDFLYTLGLKPIEWSYARELTKKPTPYIGQILEAAFSYAQAILVLVTGDDVARLGRIFTEAGKVAPKELTPQARPNVIFEAGMAFGRDENRVVLVELGEVRDISDLAGRHTVRLDDSPDKRLELAEKLKSAGCDVNMENKRHWLRAGQFQAAITHPDATYDKGVKKYRKAMESAVDSTGVVEVNDSEELARSTKVVIEIIRDGVFKDKEVLSLEEFEATTKAVWPDYEKAVLMKLCTDGIVSIEDAVSGKPLVRFNKDFGKA